MGKSKRYYKINLLTSIAYIILLVTYTFAWLITTIHYQTNGGGYNEVILLNTLQLLVYAVALVIPVFRFIIYKSYKNNTNITKIKKITILKIVNALVSLLLGSPMWVATTLSLIFIINNKIYDATGLDIIQGYKSVESVIMINSAPTVTLGAERIPTKVPSIILIILLELGISLFFLIRALMEIVKATRASRGAEIINE